jgi:hypothetical protein
VREAFTRDLVERGEHGAAVADALARRLRDRNR